MDRDDPKRDPEAAQSARVRSLQPLRPAVLHILEAIASGEEHGYAIMRHVEQTTGGAVSLGPGTLYGSLGRMQGQGLVREREGRPQQAEDDPRRRY